MRLILVRHGQTEWNAGGRYQGQSNVALSDTGRKQARFLAERFPVRQLDAIYTSDLDRAKETAECVGKRLGLTVCPEKAFRELSFGDWEGLTYQEISSRWPEEAEKLFTAPDELFIHRPNGGRFRARRYQQDDIGGTDAYSAALSLVAAAGQHGSQYLAAG